jgi:hypothetical protein
MFGGQNYHETWAIHVVVDVHGSSTFSGTTFLFPKHLSSSIIVFGRSEYSYTHAYVYTYMHVHGRHVWDDQRKCKYPRSASKPPILPNMSFSILHTYICKSVLQICVKFLTYVCLKNESCQIFTNICKPKHVKFASYKRTCKCKFKYL